MCNTSTPNLMDILKLINNIIKDNIYHMRITQAGNMQLVESIFKYAT